MILSKTILRLAAPLPKVEQFRRCLFVGPHPDDIEIGAGATVAKLAAEGKEICFLICTDGRFGFTNAPAGISAQELADLRKKEALASARVLGVRDVRFLELSDGGLYDRSQLLRGIAGVIGEFSPEILFAPDPCVDSECHADHRNVGEAVRELAFFASHPEIMAQYGAGSVPAEAVAFYMTAKPNRFVKTSGYTEAQKKALACHESQFPEGVPDTKALLSYLKIRDLDLGIRTLSRHAEGFRVLGKTQMHCLPEFG